MRNLLLIIALFLVLPTKSATPLDNAIAAFRSADYSAALKILDKEISADPEKLEYYLLRGDVYSAQGKSDKAITDFTEVLKRRSDSVGAMYRRGMEYFRAVKIKESIADFDKLAEHHPDRAPQLWQRGIAYYYAGEFDKGRKQF